MCVLPAMFTIRNATPALVWQNSHTREPRTTFISIRISGALETRKSHGRLPSVAFLPLAYSRSQRQPHRASPIVLVLATSLQVWRALLLGSSQQLDNLNTLARSLF